MSDFLPQEELWVVLERRNGRKQTVPAQFIRDRGNGFLDIIAGGQGLTLKRQEVFKKYSDALEAMTHGSV